MTFRYALTLPASGSHKLPRFESWRRNHAPHVACSLPPQVPVEAESLTIRLRSLADREHVRFMFPDTLP